MTTMLRAGSLPAAWHVPIARPAHAVGTVAAGRVEHGRARVGAGPRSPGCPGPGRTTATLSDSTG